MPLRMRPAIPRLVQLAQAAAKCFDLLLVGNLLSLGQLERFQYFFHVIQRPTERLDDLVDLLDRLLNARQGRRLPVPERRWGSFFFHWGNLFIHLSRFHSRSSRFRRRFGVWGWWLGHRRGPAPPATSVSAAGSSATSIG